MPDKKHRLLPFRDAVERDKDGILPANTVMPVPEKTLSQFVNEMTNHQIDQYVIKKKKSAQLENKPK